MQRKKKHQSCNGKKSKKKRQLPGVGRAKWFTTTRKEKKRRSERLGTQFWKKGGNVTSLSQPAKKIKKKERYRSLYEANVKPATEKKGKPKKVKTQNMPPKERKRRFVKNKKKRKPGEKKKKSRKEQKRHKRFYPCLVVPVKGKVRKDRGDRRTVSKPCRKNRTSGGGKNP